MLPRVTDSSEIYGYTDLCGVQVPVAGIAATSRPHCLARVFSKGEAKTPMVPAAFC